MNTEKIVHQTYAPGFMPKRKVPREEADVEMAPRSLMIWRDVAVNLSPFATLQDPSLIKGLKVHAKSGLIILRKPRHGLLIRMIQQDKTSELRVHMGDDVITLIVGRKEAARWMIEMAREPRGSMIDRLIKGHDAQIIVNALTLNRDSA